MFVVKINNEKGTVTVCDTALTSKEFNVNGFACTTSNGAEPSKFSWFRVKDFHSNVDAVVAGFPLGKDLSSELKWGAVIDAERKLYKLVTA
tara:strand:+ start:413 stop:685 length:273 start_codon:yes stop_codon:yes gene_type:complete